jgi:glycosyltransferase involved in cell wall biosynthesis
MLDQPDRTLPLISIIIPVYNEEKNIVPAYEAVVAQAKLLKDRYCFEILFSDNHSEDGTEAELVKLAAKDPSVGVIRLARNFGFQRSVLTAFRHVSGAAAVQLDCDLQDPPALIPAFLEKWEAGHDVVVGIRRTRKESRLLQFGRRMFYKLVTAISDDNIVENVGDFRLVDRSVIDKLSLVNDAWPYTRGLVSSLAARQTGIEYDRKERLHEQSKFPLRRLTGFAADGIVSHSLVPLRLATFMGVVIFVAAISIAAYYALAYLITGQSWPAGFATLAILLLFSVGMNAIFIGIVGEYVGRIYDQVRGRPLTIIEHTINMGETQPKTDSAKK